MSGPHFPEGLHMVVGLPPTVGTAAPIVGDYISVKNAHKVWCIVLYNQDDVNSIVFGVNEATGVAPAGVAAITATMPIYANLATGTNDRLVQQAAAATFASGAGIADKMIVFEVDPSILSAGCDCIALRSDTNIAAVQWVSYIYLIEPRYAGPVAQIPSYVID